MVISSEKFFFFSLPYLSCIFVTCLSGGGNRCFPSPCWQQMWFCLSESRQSLDSSKASSSSHQTGFHLSCQTLYKPWVYKHCVPKVFSGAFSTLCPNLRCKKTETEWSEQRCLVMSIVQNPETKKHPWKKWWHHHFCYTVTQGKAGRCEVTLGPFTQGERPCWKSDLGPVSSMVSNSVEEMT